MLRPCHRDLNQTIRLLNLVLTATLLLTLHSLQSAESPVYHGLKPGGFMKQWLVLKPIPLSTDPKATPDQEAQKQAFAQDSLADIGGETRLQTYAGLKQKISGRELEWTVVDSKTDEIDLRSEGQPGDFAIAYAYAEITLPVEISGLLGVGSDDAVKIWLNGKLIHENWSARACQADDDIVPVSFQRGTNRLLFKIQNIEGDWAFTCRLMSSEDQARKLIKAVWTGSDVETLQHLLDQGVDINSRGEAGLTAIQAARVRGDTALIEFLTAHGAITKADIPPPQELVESLFTNRITRDSAGAAVLVAQDGKILFEKGYGLADVEQHVPVTAVTKFRIGSITKQFTAAAILKLQEQGKLSVQDKLAKYIPDFPRGDEVTLHHLLTHTSGIHSYTDKPGFFDTVTKPVTPAELINSFKHDPYDFDPGKKWRYDNSGYFLLGYIVEKVSGQTYGDFLARTFFEPLGMTNTGVYRSDLRLDHEALGYKFEQGRFSKALNWDMSWAGGAGALYSTVEDLYRWNEAVFSTGKLLKEPSLQAAFTAVKTTENKEDDSNDGYGYGWGLSRFRGVQEISHGGGLQGFTSYLLRLPRENFTVAVLVNAAPAAPGLNPAELAHEITELYLGEKLPPRPIVKVDKTVSASSLDSLVGHYDYAVGILDVTREGNHLYAQFTGQQRNEIFAKSATEFFWKVVDAQVTFVKDASGKSIKAIHHQNGQTINAPRIEDTKEAKIDPALFASLIGRYDYSAGKAILTVTREGDHLFAQLTGQPKFEIFPKSPTEFFWKVVNAQVTFVKDDAGKVIKVIHHQAGRTFDAPRIE
jgi:CubicO group peptidase (beta-lactamase class C family)